jgi:hypothetical protein
MIGILKKVLLILMISVCCVSCKQAIDLNTKDNHEHTGMMKFHNDTAINILESKKAGNRIFFKYQKNMLTGLISVYQDSVMFINDTFFLPEKADIQSFDFIDSNRIVFNILHVTDDKTINRKCIFRLNNSSNEWLPDYAEKKEVTAEQSVYHFTNSFPQNISMCNFSAEQTFESLFSTTNNNVLQYKYRKKNYTDSIEIQVNNMRLANATSFKNIFTIDHAEEILHDYPLNKTNVVFLNNIAYYLEQMSITMPAITILETVITDYPDRTVGYLNLYDALLKNGLKVKAEKIYSQYVKLKNNKK